MRLGEEYSLSTGIAESVEPVAIKRSQSSTCAVSSKSKVWHVLADLEEETNLFSQILHSQSICSNSVHGNSNSVHSDSSIDLSPTKVSSSITKHDLHEMISIVEKAMERKDWDAVICELEHIILLFTTDTGGQTEFLGLQASLVHGPSLNLLFSRLVDELDSKYKESYTDENGLETVDELFILTVQDCLFQTLHVVVAPSVVRNKAVILTRDPTLRCCLLGPIKTL